MNKFVISAVLVATSLVSVFSYADQGATANNVVGCMDHHVTADSCKAPDVKQDQKSDQKTQDQSNVVPGHFNDTFFGH
jgi:hypothetical protein